MVEQGVWGTEVPRMVIETSRCDVRAQAGVGCSGEPPAISVARIDRRKMQRAAAGSQPQRVVSPHSPMHLCRPPAPANRGARCENFDSIACVREKHRSAIYRPGRIRRVKDTFDHR